MSYNSTLSVEKEKTNTYVGSGKGPSEDRMKGGGDRRDGSGGPSFRFDTTLLPHAGPFPPIFFLPLYVVIVSYMYYLA